MPLDIFVHVEGSFDRFGVLEPNGFKLGRLQSLARAEAAQDMITRPQIHRVRLGRFTATSPLADKVKRNRGVRSVSERIGDVQAIF